ncbi:MAG: replicative DNA helicase, partial [Candidatus Dormibacteraeota bacterium]|nr:replicative DNA helicase [Candidatus Dormibacteraeota bacterium]MBO0761750.1 replicative DNA helicase [Candidatus Dormibacteraeota bacterium]
MEGRVPPHDLEAEASVLGAILLDPMAIARVLELVVPEDFYRENNAQIFRAATDLFREGEPIDNVTLAAQLEKMGVLERVGGRAHLAMLQEQTPTAANVEHYARIVKARAYKRALITAGGQVSGLGYDDSVDAEEAINQAQSHVYAIAEHRVGTGMERLYDLLKPAMDKIDAQMASGGGVVGIASGFHDLDRVTNGFKASDMVVIAGRPSMGKCAAASTLIDDPQTGERLTVEECVRRRMGFVMGVSDEGRVRPARVSDWVDSGLQECFRLRTRLGRSVEVTGHHPFLTVDGWQPLHDLAVGDRIGLPRRVCVFGTDTSWSPELIRLLAYYVAEGGLTTAQPAFTNTDAEIVADFRACVGTCFPDVAIRHSRKAYYVRGSRPGPRANAVTAWLRELGLMGKGAHEKRFPSFVWRWDREHLIEFVRALMSCDGTIYDLHGYPRIEFAVASRELAEDLQHALVRLGIVAKLWKKKERCWRLDVTEPQSVAEYQREVGWIGEKSQRFPDPPVSERRSNLGQLPASVWSPVRASAAERQLTLVAVAQAAGEYGSTRRGFNPHAARGLPSSRLGAYARVLQDAHLRRLASPDLYWDEIVSIEPIGKHQVYDLSVPDGANFIAQDVVVHNTSFVLNVTLNAAVEQKQPVAIFSLEMSKEQLVERMLCEQARIDAQRLHRGLLSEAEHERLVYALGPLGDAPIFIDDSPMLDDLTLRLKARQAKARDGIELVIVDYLQLMHGRVQADDGNRVQEVSHISRSMKAIARELRVPVIAISQLSRAPEARPDKRPILSDLRESGCLTGDTRVYLPDEGRHRRLDELAGQTGFRVLALDPQSWYLEPREVTNAFGTGRKPVHRLRTSSGRTIRATANHKFLGVSGWKRLDKLATGDDVALPRFEGPSAGERTLRARPKGPSAGEGTSSAGGCADVDWDRIVSIEPDGEEDVYDLTVDGLHNFVANDVIVHNSIEQDADLVMFLYRDEYYNREKSEKPGIAEVLVAKHRNGPTGSVELAFRKELTRFENLDRRRAEVETAEP